MNKKLKKKWVDALRSGEYEQGKHCLYDSNENTYCCLGVLCEVLGLEKDEDDAFIVYEDRRSSSLGDKLLKDVKLDASKESKLINMNDSGNRSFKYIASYIDRYL